MRDIQRLDQGACVMVVENTGAAAVTLEQAILFLREQEAASGSSSSPRDQIVYQRCPDCRKARVGTRDGFVELFHGGSRAVRGMRRADRD